MGMKLNVEFDVTPEQGLALMAMFEYWNKLASQGSSRDVAFHVDGDGNFHPNCRMKTDMPMKVTDEVRERAVMFDDGNGNRIYDFDSLTGAE